MYSQSKEEQYITEYFKDFTGTLLDIGANDGKTFSNSLRLIELGWKAVLVEPAPTAWDNLLLLHGDNEKVVLVPLCIGQTNKKVVFHESGHHLPSKSDRALLSTVCPQEKTKWAKVAFQEMEAEMVNYETLCKRTEIKDFDFITIDAEGMDVEILRQIDLSATKLLCIEWNGNPHARLEIEAYCSRFGMDKLIYTSGENLLIAR